MGKSRTDRFFAKVIVDPVTGCWPWQGHVTCYGYGQFWDGERVRPAHTYSYELRYGPLPEGKEPDHLCRNRRCTNPEHLEAVTRRENLLRGDTIPARKAAQTHCIRGHLLEGSNLHINANGTRACRTCRAQLNREWAKNNRERRREIDRQSYARRKSA